MPSQNLGSYTDHLNRLTPAAASYSSRYASFQKSEDQSKSAMPAESQRQDPSGASRAPFTVTDIERDAARSSAVAHANDYYNIVTRSYERGWSQHFHWTPIAPGDTIDASLRFYVHKLALLMRLTPQSRVLDVGCGIGGPARELAKFVGCEVIGITINQFQVDRAIEVTARAGLGHLVTFVRGDFMDLPFPEGWFDGVVGCEATCHAPELERVYAQVNRVLKVGGVFGLVEEVLDDGTRGKWDEGREQCREVRNRIEVGGGMPTVRTASYARAALGRAGFKVEVDEDFGRCFEKLSSGVSVVFEEGERSEGEVRAVNGHECFWEGKMVKSFSTVKVPVRDGSGWYLAPPPSSSYPTIQSTKESPIPPVYRPWWYPLEGTKEAVALTVSAEDRRVVSGMMHWKRRLAFFVRKVYVWLGWSPAGMVHLNKMLELYVDGCVDGGKEDIFSPCWMFICKKVEGACDPELLRPAKHNSAEAVPGRSKLPADNAGSTLSKPMAVTPRPPPTNSEVEEEHEGFSTPQTDAVDRLGIGVLAKP